MTSSQNKREIDKQRRKMKFGNEKYFSRVQENSLKRYEGSKWHMNNEF